MYEFGSFAKFWFAGWLLRLCKCAKCALPEIIKNAKRELFFFSFWSVVCTRKVDVQHQIVLWEPCQPFILFFLSHVKSTKVSWWLLNTTFRGYAPGGGFY